MTSEAQFFRDNGEGIAASMEQVAAFVGHFSQAARAEACVGPDRTANGHTVIPIASVSVQAGFGLGYGGGSRADQGQGGGGGGRGASRVIALVDVSESGVNVRLVPDVTTIASRAHGFDWPGSDHKERPGMAWGGGCCPSSSRVNRRPSDRAEARVATYSRHRLHLEQR